MNSTPTNIMGIDLSKADMAPRQWLDFPADAFRGPVQGTRRKKVDPKAKARRKQAKASRRRNRR